MAPLSGLTGSERGYNAPLLPPRRWLCARVNTGAKRDESLHTIDAARSARRSIVLAHLGPSRLAGREASLSPLETRSALAHAQCGDFHRVNRTPLWWVFRPDLHRFRAVLGGRLHRL